MLAPLLIATRRLPRQPARATYFFRPATASAPAGSTIERVSSNTSWIAAQISSVLSSTHLVHQPAAQREGLLAHAPHRHAVGEDADALERDAPPGAAASRACWRHPRGSTPMTFTAGYRYFTYTAMPASSPPPPTGTKIASSSPPLWRRISTAMVPWPAITSGSSNGCTNTRLRSRASCSALLERAVVVVAVQQHLGAEVDSPPAP